jgi:outer membrane protein
VKGVVCAPGNNQLEYTDMRKDIGLIAGIVLAGGMNTIVAQAPADTILQKASLTQCVQYALAHQPTVQQAAVDERIAETAIRVRLSDWLPQINGGFNYQHNFQLQRSVFQGGTPTTIGVYNTSGITVGLNQAIFNRDVFLANRTAKDVRRQAKQNTSANKIEVAVTVSKAFYDVLLTGKQVSLIDEDIARIDRSLKDATHQYKAGIVDKTDYKRAQIALNNSQAQKKQYQQQYIERIAWLKQQMGYPDSLSLELTYDSVLLEQQIMIDTLQKVAYDNRIEFQQLQTQRRLLDANLLYYKYGALPSVGLFGGYNINFFNNSASKLYNTAYPNSFAGITLAIPIFRGSRRVWEMRQANLEINRLDLEMISLRNAIIYQYNASIAAYKSSLASYLALKDNLSLAEEVYNTIQLQYKAGIKLYLDVIIAQTDLRTTQVNYLNALYQVLSSELDVQRALGSLTY